MKNISGHFVHSSFLITLFFPPFIFFISSAFDDFSEFIEISCIDTWSILFVKAGPPMPNLLFIAGFVPSSAFYVSPISIDCMALDCPISVSPFFWVFSLCDISIVEAVILEFFSSGCVFSLGIMSSELFALSLFPWSHLLCSPHVSCCFHHFSICLLHSPHSSHLFLHFQFLHHLP